MRPFDIIKQFEKEIASWCGAKYGIAVDSCTMAIFLSLKYLKVENCSISCPSKTYPGVACSIINAGAKIKFKDFHWQSLGYYYLSPTNIVDSAIYFKKDMYIPDTLYCLSFHYKKHIPIGRGGMILTDDKKSYNWLRQARFDGRHECSLMEDKIKIVGWNCYMTPEQANRGLLLFSSIKDKQLPILYSDYPDLSKIKAYNCNNYV